MLVIIIKIIIIMTKVYSAWSTNMQYSHWLYSVNLLSFLIKKGMNQPTSFFWPLRMFLKF